MRALGFLLAGLTAVAFGLYMVPRRFSHASPDDFSTCMGIGVAVTLALPLLTGTGRFVLPGFLLAVGSGVVFALATRLFVLSVDRLGLSRATPVKNLAGVFGTVFGLWLLAEYRDAGTLLIAQLVLGSLLIALGAYLIGGVGHPRGAAPAPARSDAAGFAFAVLSAACFGFYLVPLRLSAPLGQNLGYLGVGLGALAGLGLPHLATGRMRCSLREGALGLLAGLLLACGVLVGTPATRLIGLSVAWPLAQLNTFVALGVGVFWLREFEERQERPRLLWATLATVAGIALLAAL